MSDCSSIDPLVTPYVDGALGAADRHTIEQHLPACSSCRSRITAEQAVRRLMHVRRPVLQGERAPEALHAKCAKLGAAAASDHRGARPTAAPMRAVWWTSLAPLAVTAALVAIVGGAFLYQLTGGSSRVMAAELTADHVKCFLLSGLVRVDQSAAAVEHSLAAKFGWAAHLPERPERAALELLGERTCLYARGRVAHIMYRHEGRPVSLFMLPKHAKHATQSEVVGSLGHSVAIWSAGDRTFALIAREPRADIERMVSFVRAGLH